MSLASNALTTIATAETVLGLTAGAQDSLLEFLINSVSASIEGYCARKFAKQVHTVKMAGHDRQRLYMDEWPIIEQSTYPTVAVDDSAYTSGEDEDYQIFTGASEGENYFYHESGWPASMYYRTGRTLADYGPALVSDDLDTQRSKKNIDVTFLAGYVLPGFASRAVSNTTIATGSNVVVNVANTTCLAIGDTVTLTSNGTTGPGAVAAATESCTISAMTAGTSVTLATVANNHAGTTKTLASTRTLPYDLEEAVINLVGLKMTQRTTRGIVMEKTPGGYQVQYEKAGDLGPIPGDIKRVLDHYARVAI